MASDTKATRPDDMEVGTVIAGASQAELSEWAEADDEPPNESESSALVGARWGAATKVATALVSDHTDDPVRLYLREISSVNFLSREGEVAIAKRIEAGRWAVISGLCESPLTFQAIVIWRDELNEGKIFLRIIQLNVKGMFLASHGPRQRRRPSSSDTQEENAARRRFS
jgi:RNA polymerase primary sigma factor